MRKIRYPLIISDFDGTLLRSDCMISERTRMAIEDYQRAGGKFAVCTGRPMNSILPRVKELGLKGLVSCFQGSVVVDIESGEFVVDGAISQNGALEICQFLETLDMHIHVYSLEGYYANKENALLRRYEELSGVKAKVVANMPLSQYIRLQNIVVRKVLVLVDPEERDEIYQMVFDRFGADYYVTSGASSVVEVIGKEYTKAMGIRCIANYYGVPVEKTVVAGDCLNDLPMLEAAGVGVAVKNAEDALKQLADVVMPFTNDEDAVAEIIEKFGYTEE